MLNMLWKLISLKIPVKIMNLKELLVNSYLSISLFVVVVMKNNYVKLIISLTLYINTTIFSTLGIFINYINNTI